ncbi:MAG: hypothetical protein KC615_21480 [Anaerolineae bacterium]|nr:hypothetical protein [Anaerolineae bacterium]
MKRLIYVLVAVLAALMIAPFVLAQATPESPDSDVPTEVNTALAALNARVSMELTLEDLQSYLFTQEVFNDASLGCPVEGQMYAQVVTRGYTVVLTYDNITYDFRIPDGGASAVLCSETPSDPSAVPTAVVPLSYPMEAPVLAVAPVASEENGARLLIVANGLPENETLLIGIGPVGSEFSNYGGTESDEMGNVMLDLPLPEGVETMGEIIVVLYTEDVLYKVQSLPISVEGLLDDMSG